MVSDICHIYSILLTMAKLENDSLGDKVVRTFAIAIGNAIDDFNCITWCPICENHPPSHYGGCYIGEISDIMDKYVKDRRFKEGWFSTDKLK